MEKQRIDKWLWCVRIFKTRTIAANECKSGTVKVNGEKAKPAYGICENNVVQVSKNGFNLTFKVEKLIPRRVSAPLAQECYSDLTPIEELNKYKDWFVGKASPERRERGAGRPTKRERREIDSFKQSEIYELD
jgi:ribosome-associated heat shock protein Hsp15